MGSDRGSNEYSVSTIPRSKEYVEHIENSGDDGDIPYHEVVEHFTKYPNKWSRIRLVSLAIDVPAAHSHTSVESSFASQSLNSSVL